MNSTFPTDTILLVGHGTRNNQGQQQFLKLAEHLRAAVAPLPVEPAYIELQPPLIHEALISLYARGLKTVLLSPALLFAAGHAKQDIPAAIELAKKQCPGLSVESAEPLGIHPAVMELAVNRFYGAQDNGNLSRTPALILTGRGSSDQSAIDHCRQFAAALAERVSVQEVTTAFLAIARPSLEQALAHVATCDCTDVVVQPHLLFDGEMLESVAAAVSCAERTDPHLHWFQAPALGSDLLDIRSASARYLTIALLSKLHRAGLPTTVGACARIDQVFSGRVDFLPPPTVISIGTELWRWSSASDADRAALVAARSELAFLLDFYLGSAFGNPNSAHSNEWWTDGVEGLAVSQPKALSFLCAGAAYWSRNDCSTQRGFFLAPFEIEFHFSEREMPIPERAIVRFGSLDDAGQIVESSYSTPVDQLIANCPKSNRDWAFAVELSPP